MELDHPAGIALAAVAAEGHVLPLLSFSFSWLVLPLPKCNARVLAKVR